MSSLRTLMIAAFVSTAALPALAAAAPSAEFVTREVSTAGLDLNSPSGIAALEQRVRDAAKVVCETGYAPAGLLSDSVRECRAEAFRSAAPELRAAIKAAETRRVQLSVNGR
jgi:UrcA family protein